MDRVEIALGVAWHHWQELSLGTADPGAAEALARKLRTAHERRASGTLDADAFVAWVGTLCPWLARQLGDVPPPPKRVWAPPPPPVPAPTPAHAAVAARIVRSG